MAAATRPEVPLYTREVAQAAGLSPRQREVLRLLCGEGLSCKEAGARLGISGKTVETHRERIQLQLGVRGTAALVRWAIRAGLVTL